MTSLNKPQSPQAPHPTGGGRVVGDIFVEEVGSDNGPQVHGIAEPAEIAIVNPGDDIEGWIGTPAGTPFGAGEHPELGFEPDSHLGLQELDADGNNRAPDISIGQARVDGGASGADGLKSSVAATHVLEPMPGGLAQSNDFEQDMPTSEQQQAAIVADILADDTKQFINQNTLIFDYGPFRDLEISMREFTGTLVDENIAHLVTSHVRQAIHDVVTETRHLDLDPTKERGVFARLSALKDLGAHFADELDPLLKKLQAADVPEIGSLRHGLQRMIATEIEHLEMDKESLELPTIGGMVLSGLQRVFKPTDKTALVGDARKHRNADLTRSLSDLYEVAGELKKNSADKDWVRTQGAQSVLTVNELTARIEGMTKGVEEQVDSLALRKGLTDVKSMLTDAGKATDDEDHKSALQASCKAFGEFIQRLTDVLGKLFNRASGGGKSVMKPA